MRILIVSQYFWPESFRINELVQSLVKRGIAVDVLTGKPNYPEGRIYPGYRAAGSMYEFWQGANIFRVPLFPRGFRSGFRLFLNYLSFIFSGTILGGWQLRNTKSDVIFIYAPSPLLQALPALFIGWIKRIPVVVYVQDLWPESLAATGYVRNPFVIRMVELLVKWIYRRSDLILVSSRPFKGSIERFSPSAEIIYYPNSVDVSFCHPDSGLKPDVPALDKGFCVVFAGNVGAAQAVRIIAEAAERLRDHGDIRFVVLGAGSELEWMRARIVELGLNNLFLAGRFPVEAMPNLLSRADVLLVTLADQPIFAATVPNKIQAYMAVGRPIIASMNGEGARLIQEADAGISVPAEDGAALVGAILKLHSMPAVDRDRLGENGRRYYQQHFDHEQLVDKLIGHLTKAMKAK
ncbi:glycosyltransferase WbuB [Laribacter hongkongensis]|uniref:glycosyltransferase family 4 protein n=1 Tax=Laribacter hongkongensis TaxID=168471 RepID=UPI00040EF58A|nr:glycosyltransferase family 4 protein [Laribacter hongkongensis]MBE5528303.1 glycosyltransferase WbuB [Laribacter hongkongensis]